MDEKNNKKTNQQKKTIFSNLSFKEY